jgi:zinc transport system permease protein
MTEFSTLFELELFRNALWASLLASVLCGVVGTLVVLKRMVALSGGVAHGAFGGLGIAYHLGFEPRWGAMAVALLSAVGLGFVGDERARGQDAAIGVLWAVGMAVGLIFLHLTPGSAPNLMGFLFGNILLVTPADLRLAAFADFLLLLLLAVCGRELVTVAFDEEHARVQGLPTRLYSTLLLVLAAFSVIVLLQLVGIVLVVALFTLPPLVALRLFRSLRAVLLGAVGVGAFVTVGGLLVSFHLDLPSGPVTVLLGALLLGAAQLLPRRALRA